MMPSSLDGLTFPQQKQQQQQLQEIEQSSGSELFSPTAEFDLEASEISAFSKTAAARAALGRLDDGKSASTKSLQRTSTATATTKALESESPKRRITASVRETGTDSMKNYIKNMCNHELLNKNEEIILAREIQILLKWEVEREQLEEQLLRYVVVVVSSHLWLPRELIWKDNKNDSSRPLSFRI